MSAPYSKRYGATPFNDLGVAGGTPADAQFLNAVEDALARLLGVAPAVDTVGVWTPGGANGALVYQKITNAQIDAAAAIDISKINFASGLVDAQIASGAAIAGSKLGTGIALSKLVAGANGQMIQTVGGTPAWGIKITFGTLAAGPPASPTTNDIWVATDVDANGAVWVFRYNNAEATHKWEFIGGTPVFAVDTAGTNRQNTVDSTWEFITGMPSLTLARAGQYRWRFGARIETTASTNQVFVGIAKTSTPASFLLPVLDRLGDSENPNWDVQAAAADDIQQGVTRAAADVVGLSIFSAPRLSVATLYGWIEVQPVRII